MDAGAQIAAGFLPTKCLRKPCVVDLSWMSIPNVKPYAHAPQQVPPSSLYERGKQLGGYAIPNVTSSRSGAQTVSIESSGSWNLHGCVSLPANFVWVGTFQENLLLNPPWHDTGVYNLQNALQFRPVFSSGATSPPSQVWGGVRHRS